MDNAALTFIIFRSIMSLALVAGGCLAIFYGYKLFSDGAGVAKGVDRFDLRMEKVRISTAGMSVGAVMMLTSAAWGYFASTTLPKMEASRDGIVRVGSSDGIVGTKVITAADKKPIGEITDVIMKDGRATDFVITTSGKKAVVQVPVNRFEFNKAMDAATLKGSMESWGPLK